MKIAEMLNMSGAVLPHDGKLKKFVAMWMHILLYASG
jgi:hypothetical protein